VDAKCELLRKYGKMRIRVSEIKFLRCVEEMGGGGGLLSTHKRNILRERLTNYVHGVKSFFRS
jgi:hypothetical protein